MAAALLPKLFTNNKEVLTHCMIVYWRYYIFHTWLVCLHFGTHDWQNNWLLFDVLPLAMEFLLVADISVRFAGLVVHDLWLEAIQNGFSKLKYRIEIYISDKPLFVFYVQIWVTNCNTQLSSGEILTCAPSLQFIIFLVK